MSDNKIQKSLPVQLTDPELRAFGDQIAKIISDHAALEDQKKEAASSFKAQLDALDAQMRRISIIITQRQEWRLVECYTVANYTALTMELYREDTGELVSSRKLSSDEMQGRLPIDEAAEAANG